MLTVILQTIGGLIVVAAIGQIIRVAYMMETAPRNKGKCKRPSFVAGSAKAIDYYLLWRRGVRKLVFDVDNTLCKTYADRLPEWAMDLLRELSRLGFEIVLASKSNPHMDKIKTQVSKIANVSVYQTKDDNLKKPRIAFFNWMMRGATMLNRVAFIGDKLTDIGRTDMLNEQLAESILVNPIGPDLRREYLECRRPCEDQLLDAMNVTRTDKDRFLMTAAA